MKKKIIVAIVALVLAIVCAVGGTLAWLSMKTEAIVNTFTYGDINITLTETDSREDGDSDVLTNSYKMVPGNKIAKDPKVTVEEGSEDCWLFVKIVKSDNYGTYLEDYAVADGWTAFAREEGVYYRQASAGDSFYVLAGTTDFEKGYVQVKTTVTKDDMQAIKSTNRPTLTFTAYAVQQANVADATTAWAIANPVTP